MAVVAYACDRVAVMYAGRVCETGPVDQVLAAPLHAYTLGLLRSLPDTAAARQKLRPIQGAPPAAGAARASCAFAPRCEYVMDACTRARPPARTTPAGRVSACLAADRLPAPRAEAA
jgi:peptide/nickel transport system ATP-binding protein/oligopeptide transport system ATP-binding protein